jgi:DNA-directed RNA polymerase subunit RPC12/RpoP
VQDQQTQGLTDVPPIRFACGACGKNLRAKAASAGKTIRCPQCGKPVLVPESPAPGDEPIVVESAADPEPAERGRLRLMPIIAVFGLMFVVIACSVYANLSFAVTDRANYQYFPPFKKYLNRNDNKHLGAEYFEIAKSLVAGEGFSNPFFDKTGPTAWMPPVLPVILAALLWVFDNNVDAVMTACLFLHGAVLIGTGFLVLALAWQTTARLGILIAAACFVVALVGDFHLWFQATHDMSLVLLALDIVVVGIAWCRPLRGWKSAACWGLVGGMLAMISPIVALTWGVLSIALMIRERAWYRLGIAVLLAGVTLSPWIIRNYYHFGKLLPVKSNAAYELWQSQCKQKDGLLHDFNGHPYASAGSERREYKAIGEIAFIEKKRELFWQSVRADPLDFFDRVAARFLGATLWFEPFDLGDKRSRPWMVWTTRAIHPLPFLALVFLATSVVWRPLHWSQWVVMGTYVLYLGPYIAVSYYERYAVPLLAVKVLLVIWGADRLMWLVWPPVTDGDTE